MISILFPFDLNSHCNLEPSSNPNCLTTDIGTVVLRDSPLFDAFVSVVISPFDINSYYIFKYKSYLIRGSSKYLICYIQVCN